MLRKEKYALIPNVRKRRCTLVLKIRVARRYLVEIIGFQYQQFIGFRADEPDRVSGYQHHWLRVNTSFPLAEDGIDEVAVNAFWSNKSYRLQVPRLLKNCHGCFLKGVGNLTAIFSHYPEFADPWIEDEENSPSAHTYIKGITYREIRDAALASGKKYSLDGRPAFLCSCTS